MKSSIKTGFLILSLTVFALLPLSASASTLYGVSMNGYSAIRPGTSSLYRIDPSSGAATYIGDLGYAVESIAIDPVTGLMYGTTTNWSVQFHGLLLIDVTTGSATEVGKFGTSDPIFGLTSYSNPSGRLFGWNSAINDYLVGIETANGSAVAIDDYTLRTGVPVIAFDNGDTLILIDEQTVYRINPSNGDSSQIGDLSFSPGTGGVDFEPDTGLLWAPRDKLSTLDSYIRVSDIENDFCYDIDTDVQYLHALAFDSFDSDSDSDEDGISDADDFCSETPSDTPVDIDGCSVEQLVDLYCDCNAEWKNHGEYVKCVAQVAEEQVADGLITSEEKGAIVSQRAKEGCGKKK